MTKIVLVCAAGMSTSLLVNKMREAAKAEGQECHIEAYPVAEANEKMKDADCVLLGPQVRYELKRLREAHPNVPIETIEMTSYGMMNGVAVLQQALALLKK